MNLLTLDMRHLVANGYQFGMTMEGVLSIDGKDKSICIITPDCMTLRYRCKINGILKYVKQEIPVDWLSTYYGSKEGYFICPKCGKRMLVLYQKQNSFSCRKCSDLSYETKLNQYQFISCKG